MCVPHCHTYTHYIYAHHFKHTHMALMHTCVCIHTRTWNTRVCTQHTAYMHSHTRCWVKLQEPLHGKSPGLGVGPRQGEAGGRARAELSCSPRTPLGAQSLQPGAGPLRPCKAPPGVCLLTERAGSAGLGFRGHTGLKGRHKGLLGRRCGPLAPFHTVAATPGRRGHLIGLSTPMQSRCHCPLHRWWPGSCPQ